MPNITEAPNQRLGLDEARRIINESSRPEQQPFSARLRTPVLSALAATTLGLLVLSGIAMPRNVTQQIPNTLEAEEGEPSPGAMAEIDPSDPAFCIPSPADQLCDPEPNNPSVGRRFNLDPGVYPGTNIRVTNNNI